MADEFLAMNGDYNDHVEEDRPARLLGIPE
jgi:hypothetical protein